MLPYRRVRHHNLAVVVTAIGILASMVVPRSAAADGSGRLDSALFGDWRWVGAETPPMGVLESLPDQDYRLSFGPETGLQMALELNRLRTSYSADGRRLTVTAPMMSTRAAWLPDSPAPKLTLLMENAAGYSFRDGTLCVDTFADGGTLRFVRIEQPAARADPRSRALRVRSRLHYN